MDRKWCVIDAEGSRNDLKGVAFYSDRLQVYLTDHEEIKAELHVHARDRYTFIAHNASYDLPVIFWTLNIPMRQVDYNGTFNRGQWKHHPKRPLCELWDSFNLSGNISLARLGKALDLPKYETPQVLRGIDPDKYEWQCERHGAWECIECYAVRDAEIVYRYMESLTGVIAAWGVKPQARIAGIAQAVWRSLDNPEPIKLEDGRIRHLARKGFIGARVECHKLGHMSPFWTADVQSMYPSVMREARFPDPQTMVYVNQLSPSDLPLHLDGIAECTVHVPARGVPPLPFAYKGLRVFPTGLLRGTWTHVELGYALTVGCQLLQVHRAAWGTRSLAPFTQFIEGLWYLRCEYKRLGDPRAQTIKVLLNSAYGRLGLRGDLVKEITEPWDPMKTLDDYMRLARGGVKSKRTRLNGLPPLEPSVTSSVIGEIPMVRYGKPAAFEHTWVNVLWAATITALARIKLHRLMVMQGDALAYVDTDSIFSTAPIVGLGEGLGELSDHTCYQSGWIVGPKLYALQAADGTVITKAKGVPRDKAEAFLHGEEVWFDSPISARRARPGGPQAGEWVQMKRQRQLVPHRRTPTNPAALELEYGWSDTIPMHVGPSGL